MHVAVATEDTISLSLARVLELTSDRQRHASVLDTTLPQTQSQFPASTHRAIGSWQFTRASPLPELNFGAPRSLLFSNLRHSYCRERIEFANDVG